MLPDHARWVTVGAVEGRGMNCPDNLTVTSLKIPPKHGTRGEPVNLQANYFRLKADPSWCLHEYNVFFFKDGEWEKKDSPAILKKLFQKALIERQLDIPCIFDGCRLLTSKELEGLNSGFTLKMTTKLDKEDDPEIDIMVAYIGKVDQQNQIYGLFFNSLLRKSLFALGLEPMGRNFYEPKEVISLPEYKLELWPGYVTSLGRHEGGEVYLSIDITHKILWQDDLLKIVHTVQGIDTPGVCNKARKKNAIFQGLREAMLMTNYNKRTYRFADIDFEMTPNSTFKYDGGDISFVDYYQKKYGVVIQYLTQPMVRVRSVQKNVAGEEQAIMLVPELCRVTGLTEKMRSHVMLMKEVHKVVRQIPSKKASLIAGFMGRLKSNLTIQKDLERWGLEFDDKFVDLPGRLLAKENMVFGKGVQAVDKLGLFSSALKAHQMLSTVELNHWGILTPQRDIHDVRNWLQTVGKVAVPLNMKISYPNKIIQLEDLKPQTYLRSLDELLKEQGEHDLQMVFVVLPNNKPDRYSVVKNRLSVELGIPSQCCLSRNLDGKSMMKANKLIIQMNAKLGGEPWAVKLPLKNTMFIGFDVCKGDKGIVGAMVSTFTSNFTKYYSTTSVYGSPEEISFNMWADVRECVHAYHLENNGLLPEKIIMFRDGVVGAGQLKIVAQIEWRKIKEELTKTYEEQKVKPPLLTFIVVNKDMGTALFQMNSSSPSTSRYGNPSLGTVVNDVITIPQRYDFYLISGAPRKGTVCPIYYNVLCDESGLEADKIQLITYKMTHMYYNVPGAVSIPAPCQYAWKLAILTAVCGKEANEKLNKFLHFL